ncbi:hypothetical protein C2E21_5537 [Chlorella sorokiniana]|uniref:Uncharacterized protein n=1 Tax=Chlorella sorokiniana TaxID=3076 RepID=A0A2P6TNR2_CHLSO|nr:hypothetical protein C2E21_5537 [Chlorella sorokiniana]|eukprot:PRW50975.1 hypothetical protein C2E21_5537 [Chlorella sorokiniana]
MRPSLPGQLVVSAAAQQASAATAPLFTRRPGPSMQELEKQGGLNSTGLQDDGFIMPLFTARELLTLQYYVRGAERYLEWGSGTSTFIVGPMAKRSWSVDNHKPWCEMMQKDKVALKFWQAEGVLHYTCVDTGPTEQFGMPGPGVPLDQKKRYPDVVDTFGQPHYDAVLVDGRYRVACALKALPYLTDASVVLVHDWEERRELYGKPLLQFYETAEQVDRLMVLRRRTAWDAVAAKTMLQEYYDVPA